ncbi:MAG: peptidoglycan DD-metalloendopeptidase family protein [Nannocystis sp.]|nr:peptidoglycan DD-metalloendopeptidase family protein [Nannocystis sp.]MBA3547492.1 peptidoglycan DD-metalloendopeptidase family protein [Nannocystis sp.]
MRLRLASFGLCLLTTACGSSLADTYGFPSSASAPGTDDGESGDDTGDESGFASASSDASTSGSATSDPTSTGWSTDGTSTGAPMTTTEAASSSGGQEDLCPRVRVVVPDDVLNVRPTPSTELEPLGTLANGAIVDVVDLVAGELLEGNDQWYEIHSPALDGYVWSGLVECTLDEAPTDGFFLPLECGMSATISQGNFGDFSHVNKSAYAFDFQLGLGTPLVAIAAGTVAALFADTMPGDPCYNGGGQECNSAANYVTLLHGDGTMSVYGHLSAVHVGLGEPVLRGQTIGLSGSTGWSTGPHAHVARQENCAFGWCQTIAVTFADVGGGGVPKTGDMVTSGNCL